ncbi:unnamed protein product [Calypogeia fissa]
MRGVMANNSSSLTHNVQAPSRPPPRDRSPDPPVGRSGCCTGFLCLGSLKRGKRIVPATRMHDSSNTSPRPWASNGGAQQSGPANQYATLSPSLLAPPSSPASFQNSAVQSSAQSPCSFPVASVPSATSQIPLERAQTMFQMGPYAHETALVSPPVFSNFTTAPSTAPFTPPPELANTHLTTPSSPDVPFAQLLANSFGTKQSVRSQPVQTYSPLPDMFERDDLQAAYQLYPGSPLAHLLSPVSGTGTSTPFPDLEPPTPVQAVATMFFPGSQLLQQDPPSRMELEVVDSSSSVQDLGGGQGEQQLPTPTTISSFLASGDDASGPKVSEYAERLIVCVNKGSDAWHGTEQARFLGNVPEKDGLEQQQSAQVALECISKQDNDTGFIGLLFADDVSSTQLEQSKRESSGQADRNLSEAATCTLSFTEASNKFPSTGNGAVADDSSSVRLEKGYCGFSDEVDMNLIEIVIRNLSSSDDISNKSPGRGNCVSADISSDQQELPSEAVRDVNQINESTCEGGGSDEITFVQLGQYKQEVSNEADRNVNQVATCNLVRTQVSNLLPGEGNVSSDDVSSVKQAQDKSEESSEELERNLRQTVLGLLGSALNSNTSPRHGNGRFESAGRPIQSQVHPAKFSSSWLGHTIADLVSRDSKLGDKIPAKLSISKITIVDTSRSGSAVHSRSSSRDSSSSGRWSNGRTSPVTRLSNGRTSPGTRLSNGGTSPVICLSNGGTSTVSRLSNGATSPGTWLSSGGGTSPVNRLSNGGTSPVNRLSTGGTSPTTRLSSGRASPVTRLSSGGTSPVTRVSNGGTYSDYIRLENVAVAGSEGYFDVSGAQQFTFTGQNFEAEPDCHRVSLQDCSGREKPHQSERGVLKVLLEHSMEMPVGLEGMDRVSISKEQQLNVPVNWIQPGAKLNQSGVDSVSRELPELGGTCSGSQTGPSAKLGLCSKEVFETSTSTSAYIDANMEL